VVLSTINPLFLDSTKPIGDKVVTNVELINILLHDGDSLYFEVLDQFGFAQKFAMQAIETKKSIRYRAEVWLKYQHQVQYRFVIESDGEQIYASAVCKALAGHIISERWEPDLNPIVIEEKSDELKLRQADFIKDLKPPREIKSHSSKPLCQPQFFDQIKSLLDELL
jgi:hypothetical protein